MLDIPDHSAGRPVDLPLVIGGIPIIPIDLSEPPLTVVMRALSLLGTIPLFALATLVVAIFCFGGGEG